MTLRMRAGVLEVDPAVLARELEAAREIASRAVSVDVLGARLAEDAKHHARAMAKAAETWRERHGGR